MFQLSLIRFSRIHFWHYAKSSFPENEQPSICNVVGSAVQRFFQISPQNPFIPYFLQQLTTFQTFSFLVTMKYLTYESLNHQISMPIGMLWRRPWTNLLYWILNQLFTLWCLHEILQSITYWTNLLKALYSGFLFPLISHPRLTTCLFKTSLLLVVVATSLQSKATNRKYQRVHAGLL